MLRWISGSKNYSAARRDKVRQAMEKTPIYIEGKRVGWALSNGEFEPAPGWTVENDHIVPISSVNATQNEEGKRLPKAPSLVQPARQLRRSATKSG